MAADALRELRCARERLRALRRLIEALGFAVPERDALLVLGGGGEEAVELLEDRRVLGIELQRAVHVVDREVDVPEGLFDRRQAPELVDLRGEVVEEGEARAA